MKSMTLEELRAEAQEAAQDGADLSIDPLTVESLIDDAEEHAASIERLGKMLGYKLGEEPGMSEMLGQVGEMIADLAALSSEVLSLPKESTPIQLGAWVRKVRDLARMAAPASVVLEIAGINIHE